MTKLDSPEVAATFERYPSEVKTALLRLRQLILDTAEETDGVTVLEETLKWGEPSYLAKGGSTVRIDWKQSSPDEYAMYFHCQTKLIDTFRELYSHTLTFDGNRAIVFKLGQDLPADELKHCISLALTYHKVKHLPLLGA